jgi:glycosyltransferase involved in cell wall biosynthesis
MDASAPDLSRHKGSRLRERRRLYTREISSQVHERVAVPVMKTVVLLYDWPLGAAPHWLASGLAGKGFEVVSVGIPNYSMRNRQVPWRKIIVWWQYLVLAARGVRLARKRGAVVVSWSFIPGALAAVLGSLCPGARSLVLALNCIAHRKGRVHSSLRRLVYRAAFHSGRLLVTVNSQHSATRYREWFGFESDRVVVVHDAWSPHYDIGRPEDEDGGYVFCGGDAARDWDTFVAVAKTLPDLPFVAVARQVAWPPTARAARNVRVSFDIPESEFYSLARRARIVILPLRSTEAAGLIVLKRLALLGRLILCTRTPATESYYPSTQSRLLVTPGDVLAFVRLVREFWDDTRAREAAARQVQEFILEERSPDAFVDTVVSILVTCDA